jgi:hypothetical protein
VVYGVKVALPSYSVAEVQAGFKAHPDYDKNGSYL